MPYIVILIFVCPPDTNIYHVWMGQALIIVRLDKNHSQYGQFWIKYWDLAKENK